MRTFNYVPRANSPGAWETGAYNCRKITNGSGFSLHAYGIAADINARTNPYGKKLITDMPLAMIAAVRRIETVGGVRALRWGGDYRSIKDAMHFEVVASPDEMARGIDWDTVVAEPPDMSDPKTWSTLRRGDRGPSVTRLHELLAQAGFTETNATVFGPKTAAVVQAYQESRRLTADSIVGLQTWTALLNDFPALIADEKSPFKLESQPESNRPTLKRGSEGAVVEELQRRLFDETFDPGPIDGVFGRKTLAALKSYQGSLGLAADGICGPLTWRSLLS